MSPSSPAFFSSCAQAVIRWSAASTSSGGSSQPISAALPESSAHRSTRASFAAASRRSLAFSGATSITALGDRGAQPARGQPRGPVQDLVLGGAGLGRVEQGGGAGDDLGLVPGDRPVVQRRGGAGQPGFQGLGQVDQGIGAAAGLAQRVRDLVRGELRVLGGGVAAGQLAETASLRAAAWASTRSHAHSTPTSSASDTPANRPSSPAAASAATARAGAAGQHVQRHPGPEPGRRAGRLAGEDPRGAGLARAAPPGAGRLDREQLIGGGLADLGQLLRGERFEAPVLVRLVLAVALVLLAQPVQGCLAFLRGHRVAVQPGEVVVSPGVRGGR